MKESNIWDVLKENERGIVEEEVKVKDERMIRKMKTKLIWKMLKIRQDAGKD